MRHTSVHLTEKQHIFLDKIVKEGIFHSKAACIRETLNKLIIEYKNTSIQEESNYYEAMAYRFSISNEILEQQNKNLKEKLKNTGVK